MYISRLRIAVAGVFIFVPALLISSITLGETKSESARNASSTEDIKETTLLFVGDMMLGRGVETRMLEHGPRYPFIGIESLIRDADIAVANFEGTVPRTHKQTEPFTFAFSIRDEYLKEVKSTGFDILSLANNHTFDFGSEGLSHTRKRCEFHRITCVGDPRTLNEFSSHIYEGEHHTIGLLFLNTIFGYPDTTELSAEIEELNMMSDVVIVSVHWGDEYALMQNSRQEALAHHIVDAGADVVIGHHPHVVQGIEQYRDGMIFYSLGNFIFDQYFSVDVQEGIAVRLTLDEYTKQFEIIPFTSKHTRAQPHTMSTKERDELLKRIFGTLEHEDGRMSMYLF